MYSIVRTAIVQGIKSIPVFVEADMSKFMASIIDFMNHDVSLSNTLATTEKMHNILDAYNRRVPLELD